MAEPPRSPPKSSAPSSRDETSRRGLSKSENAATPVTPPARYISSNFSTPGSTYGKEEDAIIVELNQRFLKAGIEGESHPQCRYDFAPLRARRVGDYREWLRGSGRKREHLDTWGQEYELWTHDLKDLALPLVGDKLERAIREVCNKHLLLDAGNARLVLVVPSLLPHPVLATILQTLFERWNFPSITLLPTPAATLISAGVRSGLVIDIGWEETVISSIYEYREVFTHRSTRAMKFITKNLATWLTTVLPPDHCLNLDIIEAFLKRMAPHLLRDARVQEQQDTEIVVEWPTSAFNKSTSFSRQEIRTNLISSLLGNENELYPDDEETPLHQLIHRSLLVLPTDVRGICISRIVFVGEGQETIQPDSIILSAFSDLLACKGWSSVSGQKLNPTRRGLSELAQTRTKPADAKHGDIQWSDKAVTEERYLREKQRHFQNSVQSELRHVHSMGPWTGASLLTTMKVKSFVEIQRDRYLAHGLSGASRNLDMSMLPQQRTTTVGIRSKAGERNSWTLSGWA